MFFSPGRMERKLVLESCLHRGSCRLLEMYILLTDDVAEFNMISEHWFLDKKFEKLTPKGSKDVKVVYYEEEDLLITLLMARCPISTGIKVKRISFALEQVNILSWTFLYHRYVKSHKKI